MKTIKLFFTIALLMGAGLINDLRATDLIVEENGVLPNYGTISDAVAAAGNGDRIFIKNKAGNVPYLENVTVGVSLELLPFDQDGFFVVQGNYTINPAIGRSVTIIGMRNLVGSITAAVNSPTGTPTRVNIMGCDFSSGSISISGTNYVSHISGNRLASGSITCRYSTITANEVNGTITINDAAQLTSEDTLYIVGNRLRTQANGNTSGRISWNNDEHYLYIANNWVLTSYGSGAIDVNLLKAGTGVNRIHNNSIQTDGSCCDEGIATAAQAAPGTLYIDNNAIYDSGSSSNTGIQTGAAAGAFVGVYFNGWRGSGSAVTGSNIAQTGNFTSSSISFSLADGECTNASCIDTGNPSTDFTDLDLSRNNLGVAGGSFNFNNFFPILTGGARVYLVKTPRTVVQTSIIKAEAESYDR